MSRKRDKQREQKKELARQLGVDKDDVPDELRSHARVTEPEIEVALEIVEAKRGLLGRAGPLAVHVGLYVVDAQGARLARAVSLRGSGARGPIALTVAKRFGEDKVRYTRPGHFVALALLTEGADETQSERHAAQVAGVGALQVMVEGSLRPIADPAIARMESPRDVRQSIATVSSAVSRGGGKGDATFVACTLVAIPAAHRVSTAIALPLVSTDEKLRANVTLSLRL